MTANERRLAHLVLQLGGAWLIHSIRATRPEHRAAHGIAFGMLGLVVADLLDGRRGTEALLRGAAEALQPS